MRWLGPDQRDSRPLLLEGSAATIMALSVGFQARILG